MIKLPWDDMTVTIKGQKSLDPQRVQENLDKIALLLSDLTGIEFAGNGDPNGVVTAGIGARYRRLDGGLATALYVKEADPTGNTGWAPK